ncbi:MAG: hypothetical protein PETM_00550 [Petrimonas sp.]|jgi:hypothetical protein
MIGYEEIPIVAIKRLNFLQYLFIYSIFVYTFVYSLKDNRYEYEYYYNKRNQKRYESFF